MTRRYISGGGSLDTFSVADTLVFSAFVVIIGQNFKYSIFTLGKNISILEIILASSLAYIVFAPAFNGKHIHPLVSSAEAPLCQVIAVKSFTAAQGMFTAIFSWLNMNKICQRTANQIRGTVNVLHSDFVCAAGQEISKAWTSILFCFQPVSHNLKGAKGSYLYLIQLNRPISPPSAAALSFALIYSWLFWFAYGLLTASPPKKNPPTDHCETCFLQEQ